MKKFLFCIMIGLILSISNVDAQEVQLNELIPVDTKATLTTKSFIYKEFYYNNNEMEAEKLKDNYIIFSSIQNISNKDKPVSITVALFDKDQKNIGVISYCSTKDDITASSQHIIKPNEESPEVVQIREVDLVENHKMLDVKYFSVLSENEECYKEAKKYYAGKTVDEIDLNEKEEFSSSGIGKSLFYVLGGLIGIIVLVLLIKLLLFGKTKTQDDIRKDLLKNYENNKNNFPQQTVDNNTISNIDNNSSMVDNTEKNDVENKNIVNENDNQENNDLMNLYK